MTTTVDPQTKQDIATLNKFSTLLRRLRWVSIGSALGAIVVFGGLGYVLDLLLDKKYFYTIIGLVIAFVVMNISVIYFSRRLAQHEGTPTGK